MATNDDIRITELKGWDMRKAVLLYEHMTIQPGSNISVKCPTSFRISNGTLSIKVSTNRAFLISVSRQPVELLPVVCLGANFAHGWDKLPNELKVRILSFNLISYIPINAKSIAVCQETQNSKCRRTSHSHPRPGRKSCSETLIHHLAMGSEIAEISKEIYYGRNIFYLEPTVIRGGLSPPSMSFVFPPRAVNSHVRHIIISISIKDQEWDILTDLSSGVMGFGNLVKLEIIFSWKSRGYYRGRIITVNSEKYESIKEMVGEGLVFQCKGIAMFENGRSKEADQYKLEDILLGGIAFKGGAMKEIEQLPRQICDNDEEVGRENSDE